MFQAFEERFIAENAVVGIEVILGTSGPQSFFAILLERQGGAARLKRIFKPVESIHALINILPQGIPISLSFTGKGVLFKEVEKPERFEGQQIIRDILPTVDPAEYFYELIENGSKAVLFVVKKNTIDTFLKRCEELSMNIQMLTLGYSSVSQFSDILEKRDIEILTVTYCIPFSADKIGQVKSQISEEQVGRGQFREVTIDEEKIDSRYLIPYASALKWLISPNTDNPGISSAYVADKAFEQSYKIKLKKAITFTLIGTLALLIANFSLFSFYFDKAGKQESGSALRQEAFAKFEKKQNEVSSREAFFEKSGWLKGYSISLLAGKIVSRLPDSVSLTQLSFFPHEDLASGINLAPSFSRDTVIISGESTGPGDLDSWLYYLRRISRMKKISVKVYKYNARTGRGEFKLEAELH